MIRLRVQCSDQTKSNVVPPYSEFSVLIILRVQYFDQAKSSVLIRHFNPYFLAYILLLMQLFLEILCGKANNVDPDHCFFGAALFA